MELIKSAYDAGKIQWHPLDPVLESTGIQWVSMTFPAPGILLKWPGNDYEIDNEIPKLQK
jgi:hypothetical protein